MTTQLTTPSPPALSPSGPVRRRTRRGTAAIAATAALIATGAYVATTSIGPDPPVSATNPDVAPSAQIRRELHDSVAGQYGSRPASDAPVNPSAPVRRELRDSVAGQYGRAR